jgi:hypothetical protein
VKRAGFYEHQGCAMGRRNYYMLLGVFPNENTRAIRQAFRKIATRYHPDRVGSERLRYFQDSLDAYHVLSDPKRRKDYDRGLYQREAAADAAPAPLWRDAESSLPEALSVLRNLSIKDAPFQAALARVSGNLTGADITSRESCEALNTVLVLSPDEAVQGGVVFLAVPSCSPCDRCGASGREGLFSCSRCDGEGLLEEEETVRVQVPPLVGDGSVMELPLRGLGIHNFYLRLHIRVASEKPR